VRPARQHSRPRETKEGGRLDYMCVMLQGVRTLVPEEGVAYIERARTPAGLHYKGLNVHKVGCY